MLLPSHGHSDCRLCNPQTRGSALHYQRCKDCALQGEHGGRRGAASVAIPCASSSVQEQPDQDEDLSRSLPRGDGRNELHSLPLLEVRARQARNHKDENGTKEDIITRGCRRGKRKRPEMGHCASEIQQADELLFLENGFQEGHCGSIKEGRRNHPGHVRIGSREVAP